MRDRYATIVDSQSACQDRIANICTDADNEGPRAIICTSNLLPGSGLSAPARDFLSHSISSNTRRAYATDLAHFASTGRNIPCTPEDIANYIAEMGDGFAVASIQRRLAAISKAHNALGIIDPVKSELVKATMRGIRRTYGSAQRQATAILRDDLFATLDKLGSRPKDIRDRALLLLGFSTALRRSELVALDAIDIEFVQNGMMVTIRRSKTDQEAHGRKIGVPFGRTRHCPVAALKTWFDFAGIKEGAIFRTMNKSGKIERSRISGEAVSHVVKTRIEAAGYDPNTFSGHSLRAGFATSAAQAGASTYKIRQVTGHKSEMSLARYIRDVDLFTDNAAARVL